nr:immunoglobulin light chain junction region [Macaca mulatta]MPN99364.1 immunoglobulin light chain junction region [Macaca mulatta]
CQQHSKGPQLTF